MLSRITAFCSGRRTKWVVVGVWLLLGIASAPLAGRLSKVTDDRFLNLLPDNAQPVQVNDLVKRLIPGNVNATVIVVYRRPGGLTAADRQLIAAQASSLAATPGTYHPVPPVGAAAAQQISPNGEVAVTVVPLTVGDRQIANELKLVRAKVEPRAPPGLTVQVTGGAALESDLNQAIGGAGGTLLLVTGFLVLFLLVAMYRSPVLAIVPLVVVGLSYSIAAAVSYLLAKGGLKVTSTSASLLLVLMFGAGTDYCLLIVTAHRDRLRRVRDHHEAARLAALRSGPAIIASGATVMGALLTLLAARLASTSTLGPVAAIGIGIVLLGALTLLPATLSIVGRGGFWPNRSVGYVPAESSAANEQASSPTLWGRLAPRLLSRPVPAIVVIVLLLAGGATGLLAYHERASIISGFRTQTDSTRGYNTLLTGFRPGVVDPVTIALYDPQGAVSPAAVTAAQQRLRAIPLVSEVTPVTSASPDRKLLTLSLIFADNPENNPALARITPITQALRGLPGHTEGLVGGTTATLAAYKAAAHRDIRVIVPLVLLVIFFTLIILLRALVAPVYLIVSVILSFFGTFGISVVFFREVLGKTALDPNLPIFVFVFLVALGVDYNIFLMDRVRRESAQLGTRAGVIKSVVVTGPVITGAGLIVAGTFASLATLPVVLLLELGLAVSFGVLVDTFLVRTILVPASTLVAGERAWWPSRLHPGNPPTPPPPSAADRGESAAAPQASGRA